MTARTPVEFVERQPDGHHKRVGNRVSLSDTVVTALADAIAIAIENTVQFDSDRLIPNPAGTDQVLEVTESTVVQFTDAGALLGGGTGSLDAATTMVRVRAEGGRMRVTFNGTTPTLGITPPGVGASFLNNDRGNAWTIDALLQAKFLAMTGFNGYLQVSEWMDVIV